MKTILELNLALTSLQDYSNGSDIPEKMKISLPLKCTEVLENEELLTICSLNIDNSF